ncbi:hypothetical protein AAMO2058_000977500 [Amorphochlora amoebiformis]
MRVPQLLHVLVVELVELLRELATDLELLGGDVGTLLLAAVEPIGDAKSPFRLGEDDAAANAHGFLDFSVLVVSPLPRNEEQGRISRDGYNIDRNLVLSIWI